MLASAVNLSSRHRPVLMMATLGLVVCLILQLVSALSAPTYSFSNSDSSSISKYEERKKEDVALRRLELEKSVEDSKELIQILNKLVSYITTHFTYNNQMDDGKSEIMTHEVHTNFVFSQLKGKIFPNKNPIYTKYIQPAIGISKYFVIIPEPRSHFENATAYIPEKYRQKNVTRTENKISQNNSTEEAISVTDLTTIFHLSVDETENQTYPERALDNPITKRVNISQNVSFNDNDIYDLNNGTVANTKTYNNEHKELFTTVEPSFILTEQTATDQDFDSNSFESAGGLLYTHENSTENSVFHSSNSVRSHSLLHTTLDGSIQHKITSNKSETESHNVTTFMKNDTRTMQMDIKLPVHQKFQKPSTVDREEVWPSKYNDNTDEGTDSSLIRKSVENLSLIRALSRNTFSDTSVYYENTSPLEPVDVTVSTTDNTELGESTNSKPFELKLTNPDKEPTTTQDYNQLLNLTEFYVTKTSEELKPTSLYSENLDTNSSNNNQNSSFSPETNNYTVQEMYPFSSTSKLFTIDHSKEEPENATMQNINTNSVGPSHTTSLNLILTHLNNASQIKQNAKSTTNTYALTDDLDSMDNVTDVLNSQSILQSHTSDWITEASTTRIYNKNESDTSDYNIVTERSHEVEFTSKFSQVSKSSDNQSNTFEENNIFFGTMATEPVVSSNIVNNSADFDYTFLSTLPTIPYPSRPSSNNDSDLIETDKERTVKDQIINKEDYSNTDHLLATTESQFTEIPSNSKNFEITTNRMFSKTLSTDTMITMNDKQNSFLDQTKESEYSDSDQTLTSKDPTHYHNYTGFLTGLDLMSLVIKNYSKSIPTSLPDQHGSYTMNSSQTLEVDSNESNIEIVGAKNRTTHNFKIVDDKLSGLNMNDHYNTVIETTTIFSTTGLKHLKQNLNETPIEISSTHESGENRSTFQYNLANNILHSVTNYRSFSTDSYNLLAENGTTTPNYNEEPSKFSNEISRSTNNYEETHSYANRINNRSREITDNENNTVESTLNPPNSSNETFTADEGITYPYITSDSTSSPIVTDVYNSFTFSETKFDVSGHTENIFSPTAADNNFVQVSKLLTNFKQEMTTQTHYITSSTSEDLGDDEIGKTPNISEEAVTLSTREGYKPNTSKDLYEVSVTTQNSNNEYYATTKTELNESYSFINSLPTKATTGEITKNSAIYAQSSISRTDEVGTEPNTEPSNFDMIEGNYNSSSLLTTELNVDNLSQQYSTLLPNVTAITGESTFNDSTIESNSITHPGMFENGNSTSFNVLNVKETMDTTTVSLASLNSSDWNLSTITSHPSNLPLFNVTENIGGSLNDKSYYPNTFQTTSEMPTEAASTSNHIDNKIETNISFIDSPTEASTITHLGTYSEGTSKSYSTLNIVDSIDITSTSTHDEIYSDVINLPTQNKNNSVVSSINDPEINQYSEEIFGKTTPQNNKTELNYKSTQNFETYTQQNELENSTDSINKLLLPHTDVYMVKYNSTNSNITKEESSISTTMKSENVHNVVTNAQLYEFTNLKHDPSNSETLDDEITRKYSTPNVLNTMEIATDKNNEKITDINHSPTAKTTEDIINTPTTSHIFNGDKNVSTYISTLQSSNATESPKATLNETTTIDSNSSEDIHDDEINTYDQTTPYFNNFTFYLPTTNHFHTRYIPVRVFPLFTFTHIK